MDETGKPGWFSRVAEHRSGHTMGAVMDYLTDAAGFDIKIKSGVPISQWWHTEAGPVENEAEALSALQEASTALGCIVLRRGRLITIMTPHDAKKECVPLPTLNR